MGRNQPITVYDLREWLAWPHGVPVRNAVRLARLLFPDVQWDHPECTRGELLLRGAVFCCRQLPASTAIVWWYVRRSVALLHGAMLAGSDIEALGNVCNAQ